MQSSLFAFLYNAGQFQPELGPASDAEPYDYVDYRSFDLPEDPTPTWEFRLTGEEKLVLHSDHLSHKE